MTDAVSAHRVKHVEEMAAALMEKYIKLQGECECLEVERNVAVERARELEVRVEENEEEVRVLRERYGYVVEEVKKMGVEGKRREAKYIAERQQLLDAVSMREYQWESERNVLVRSMGKSASMMSKKTQTENIRLYDRATSTTPTTMVSAATLTTPPLTHSIGSSTTPHPTTAAITQTDDILESEDDQTTLSPLSTSPPYRSPPESEPASSPPPRSLSRDVVWTTSTLISEMLKDEEDDAATVTTVGSCSPVKVIAPAGAVGREIGMVIHSPRRCREEVGEEETICSGEVESLYEHPGVRVAWPVGALCRTVTGVEGRVKTRVGDGFIVESDSMVDTYCRPQDVKIQPPQARSPPSPTISSLSASSYTASASPSPTPIVPDRYPRRLHPGHYQQVATRAGKAYTPKKFTIAKLAGC